MNYGADYKKLPVYSKDSGKGREIARDVFVFTDQIVNLMFIGDPEGKSFVIVDAGMPKRADKIIEAAYDRFGKEAKPEAIILTHGHFDHVGSVIELIEEWDVPVYAGKEEMPHLTGFSGYPEPDFKTEGGMVSKMSKIFPIDPIDISGHVEQLPDDGSVPYLPAFKWVPVPGHTKGQVALYRKEDGLLIAADAFVTTKQENLYDVITQKEEISGPPRYLTPDWKAAKESVLKLAKLNPKVAVTGHGHPMSGEQLVDGLTTLLEKWEDIALPSHGKFVEDE